MTKTNSIGRSPRMNSLRGFRGKDKGVGTSTITACSGAYKLYLHYLSSRMKHHSPITVHHRLPYSWGGNLKPNNAMHLRENVHRAVHTLFQDETPIQRIRRLIEVDKPVMKPEVYQEISNVLKKFEGIVEIGVYEPECFNEDKFYTKLHLGN